MSILPKETIREIIKSQNFKSANDIHSFLKDIMKDFIQESLEIELDSQLGYEKNDKNLISDNSRNGYSKKKVKSSLGEIELDIPRDRNAEFEPHIVPKYSRDISNLEEKIISMYGLGMVTRDISKHINEIYGIDVSAETISKITDKLIPSIEKWKTRTLEDIYYFVFLDAIHFSVREDKSTVKKAAYVVLGVDQEGKKDILGIYIGTNESSKFWLMVLNDLKSRGVKDILILCADGLSGMKKAVTVAFPKTEYQRCIVHQVRNTLKYVSDKDKKAFANDLKTIYQASSEKVAVENLEKVTEIWEKVYPNSMKSWKKNWDIISPIFKFSQEVRKVIYTTNAIESLNSVYRRLNNQRSVFPSDTALLKALYLSTFEATKKWTTTLRNWGKVYGELQIMYEDRFSE